MKIIHITNYFMPNLGYQEFYLAKYQAEIGHEVHIITSDKAYPIHSDYRVFKDIFPSRQVPIGNFNTEGFTVHRLPIRFEQNMQLIFNGMIDLINNLSPDVIYFHGFTRFEMLHITLWKKFAHKSFKIIIDEHMQLSAYVERGYRKLYYWIINFFIRSFNLFDSIDKVVAISTETKKYLQLFFSIPIDKLSVIYLGVDRDKFIFSDADRIVQRKELGIPEDAFLILYAGKIIPAKKCELVYEISKDYLHSASKIYLLFVGSGIESEYAQKIKESIEIDHLEHKVMWHSHIDHDKLPQVFSAADAAIWPYQETMAALEAASCSVPIILRNSDIAQEYVSNGNGFACASLEEQKIALGKLINNPTLRQEMGEKGVETIKKKYDWRIISGEFLRLCSTE